MRVQPRIPVLDLKTVLRFLQMPNGTDMFSTPSSGEGPLEFCGGHFEISAFGLPS